MEEFFQLSEREKYYKREYENGGAKYLEKPMSIWEFEKINNSKQREHYVELERYHKELTTYSQGNTVREPAVDGDSIEIVVHSRYGYPILHNHEYIELIYVYSGTCLHFVEDKSFEMRKGDVCLLTPNAMHAISAVQDDAVIINIMMSKNMFDTSFFQLLKGEKVLSEFFEHIFYHTQVSPYILFPTGEDSKVQDIVKQMYLERKRKEYLCNESQILYVKQLFIHLIRRYEMFAIIANPMNHAQENHIIGIIGYITVNYNHTSLKETAAFFGYNETYLGQMIQRYTGKTFCNLVTEIQMNHAKSLLKDSKLSITEIGNEIGCYDSSHFSRKFKGAFGMTPKEFRKKKE